MTQRAFSLANHTAIQSKAVAGQATMAMRELNKLPHLLWRSGIQCPTKYDSEPIKLGGTGLAASKPGAMETSWSLLSGNKFSGKQAEIFL
jgi:hypothetical protein